MAKKAYLLTVGTVQYALLLDAIIGIKEQEDYDQVWCVFDRDSWTIEDFNNAIKNADEQGFKVAYSNEAFELWYVLHF